MSLMACSRQLSVRGKASESAALNGRVSKNPIWVSHIYNPARRHRNEFQRGAGCCWHGGNFVLRHGRHCCCRETKRKEVGISLAVRQLCIGLLSWRSCGPEQTTHLVPLGASHPQERAHPSNDRRPLVLATNAHKRRGRSPRRAPAMQSRGVSTCPGFSKTPARNWSTGSIREG